MLPIKVFKTMKIVRFQQKRLFIIGVCVILCLLTLHALWSNNQAVSECVVPLEVHQKMGQMLEKMQDALEALNLSYFLCYNSLWGALKIKGPLPWQNNLDLCILNKEVSKIDEGFLVRTFKRYGLSVSYNSASGIYRVVRFGETVPTATLTVFELDSLTNQMRRVGWVHRMLPPDSCDKLHCFPTDLISSPLPKIKFWGYDLPAPREEIEIQKYLFPDSWWKDINPADCTQASIY